MLTPHPNKLTNLNKAFLQATKLIALTSITTKQPTNLRRFITWIEIISVWGENLGKADGNDWVEWEDLGVGSGA
jgi:hypothetical protein